MTVNFFVQARLGSSRFPGKCLETVAGGVTLLDSLDRRIRRSRHHGEGSILYLTSTDASDDRLADFFTARGWPFLRGSETDVHSRFRAACERRPSDLFVRICGDNPLLDPGLMDQTIDVAVGERPDYASFADGDGTPVILTHYGFFAEAVSTAAFLSLDDASLDDAAREHVTPPLYAPEGGYRAAFIPMPAHLVDPGIRFTVDTPEDLGVVRAVFSEGGLDVTVEGAYAIVRAAPGLMQQMRAAIDINTKA